MATFLQAQRKGFTKGSTNLYTCRICGHRTRPTGTGDNDGVQLCVDCWDLAGEENSHNDNGEFYCNPAEVLNTIQRIVDKGGDASRWDEVKKLAQAALNPTPAAELPAGAGVKPADAAPAQQALAREYLTDTGKVIGNKTAANLIIKRAKAQLTVAQGGELVALVQAELDTFISDVKPTDRRVASLINVLKIKGYKW